MTRPIRAVFVAVFSTFAILVATVAPGSAQPPPPPSDGVFNHDFASPVLGLNAIHGTNLLFAADAGAGIARVSRGGSTMLADLPGVNDVLPMSRARGFAITGGPPPDEGPPEQTQSASLQSAAPAPSSVYVFRGGHLRLLADIGAREARLNPDGEEIDSNPFDMYRRGGLLGVSDAGANTLWGVRIGNGRTRVIAVFPGQVEETQWLKDLVGCPEGPPDLCDLPPELYAQSVPTGVTVGPDGAWYVAELRGFGAGPGTARVWRIEAGTWNADCSVDPRCEVVATGFTSIIDIAFTADGRLVVAEMDELTFLAAEEGLGVGGAIWVCEIEAECNLFADGLPLLTSIALGRGDRVFAIVFGVVPGSADIVSLGRITS
ncbi:MAG: ScyD/ScyE family protein [Acidimicrobiales bacterium]